MAKLLASSQITIVDLNDAISLRSYIDSSHTRVQFLDNDNRYTPDYVATPITLTAHLNKIGDNTDIIKNLNNVSKIEWFVKLTPNSEYIKITSQMTEYELVGTSPNYTGLKIKKNIMNQNNPGATFKVAIDYQEEWMQDVHTQISEIDFSLSIQGEHGVDSYTVLLTNSDHSIICSPSGIPESGELGETGRAYSDTLAYKGTELLTAVTNNPKKGQYSITLESVNCLAVKKDSDTFYIDDLIAGTANIGTGKLTSFNLSTNNLSNGGKINVVFNLEGSTVIRKEMTFSKVFNGLDAPIDPDDNIAQDGESAKYTVLSIKEGTSIFKYEKDQATPIVPTTVLEIISYNIMVNSYKWLYFNKDNNRWTTIPNETLPILSINHDDHYFNNSNSVTFKCIVNELYEDELTLSKVIDGNDAITIQLTNESHVIACNTDGTFKEGEAERATTSIIAYKGSNELEFVIGTPIEGQYSISVLDNPSVQYTVSNNTIKITNMTTDSTVIVIDVNCEGTVYKRTMSLSKAKDGEKGSDGYTINLTNPNHNIMCDKKGNPLTGELGANGKALCGINVVSNDPLTATNGSPQIGQYSFDIFETVGCTAIKKDSSTFYIDTLTSGITGKVVIAINVENKFTAKREMSFVRVVNTKKDLLTNGDFLYGKNYWGIDREGTPLTNDCTIIKSSEAIYGSNILQATNMLWAYSNETFDIEDDKIYRIKFRARQTIENTSGEKIYYIGYTPYNNSNQPIGTDGANNNYLKRMELPSNWIEDIVYVSRTARSAITNLNGQILFPEVKAFPENAVKFKPMFIVNYSVGNGTAQVDGYILEDATEDFQMAELTSKTVKLETDITGINASVSSIKTITDMSTNPITLVAKVNYSAYATPNPGEFYLHGLDNNRAPADIDGVCLWQGTKQVLPKTMFNPNGKVPEETPIYIVRNIADNKWWSIWKVNDT